MTAITATKNNADASVDLNVSGMDVVGSSTGTWGTASAWSKGTDTTLADTAGDATYGANMQAVWSKTTSSYGSVWLPRASHVAGQYYAFVARVRLDPARPDVPGDVEAPVEVWLDTTASKPWGEDSTGRRVIYQKSTTDPDPYGYTELWLFYQASATTENLYIRWRPLYPHETSSILYVKNINTRNGAIDPKRSTPRLWRTDVNGRRELEVPYIVGDSPLAAAWGPFTDYEAALVGNVTYEVADVSGNSDTVDASTTVSFAGTATTKPRLSRTSTAEDVEVDLVTAYSADRNGTATLHRVVNRATPIVLEGPLAAREGELEVWCADYPTALAVVGILKSGEELIYRQATHAGMDLRFVPTRVTERPATDDGRRWLVSCAYVETS